MTSKRFNYLLTGFVGLLVLGLVAGAYGVNSMLSKEASNLAALKAKSRALSTEQDDLKVAKQSLDQYADLEKIAHAVVPEDKNQAEAVRQIVNIAAANGVSLASINFPASTLGSTATGSAPSSTSVATPKPSTAGSKTSQLQSVKNIPGVYELPITVTSDSKKPVPYYQFVNFLNALEHNRRTAQVSTITLQPDNLNHNNLSFILILNEYIKP